MTEPSRIHNEPDSQQPNSKHSLKQNLQLNKPVKQKLNQKPSKKSAKHYDEQTNESMPQDLSHLSPKKRLEQTEFMLSAPTFKLCPPDTGFEVAFAGRSNAGKSSAINVLTNQRQLARSSKTPGRTQMINFFGIGNSETRLVDLPGYGYAAVPEAMKNKWQVELEEYLVSRISLAGLVLLMDIRHPLKFFDQQMLQWAKDGELPVHVLLTKADKFKYGPAKNILLKTKQDMNKLDLPFTIQLFSSLKKEGVDELAEVMGRWLRIDGHPDNLDSRIIRD